jgi:hypothetical protein
MHWNAMGHSTNPFTPRSPLSRELLERYANGGLSPEERHAVELHLESDPLLRDALQGLQQPGALTALQELQRPNANSGGVKWNSFVLPAVLVLGGIGAWWFWPKNISAPVAPEQVVAVQQNILPQVDPAAVESTLQVVHAEIAALPVSPQRSAPRATPERFDAPESSRDAVKRETVERIAPQPVTVEHDPMPSDPRKSHSTRPSRLLVFLHDMKVVHPKELYGMNFPVLPSPGVPADVGGAKGKTAPAAPASQAYLDFMNGALGALAAGDDRIALDDLYFLLGQYPADVNAQFYAGLACYRLGLYPRAMQLLHGAALNDVDSFVEEAVWYEALATDKQDGWEAAQPALKRIAEGGGFYAVQAKTLLDAR